MSQTAAIRAAPAPHRSLLIVGLGTLVVPLDSAVNIDFPAIVAHFALPIPMIQWIVISYTLTQTSLMLTFGRIGDILGYRRVFLAGTGFSTLAFLACALAPTYPALIAARIAQGIGAGLILSVGPALATSLFPEARRAEILGRYMAMFGIGQALGPSVFGVLVDQLGWSAVFSLRAPVALTAFALAWTLPQPPRTVQREPFDLAGGVLLSVAMCSLLLALNQARHLEWAGLAAALAALACGMFYRQEIRCPRPIIDFAHFRRPGFTVINLANVLVNLAAFAIMLLAPFYLARVPGLSLPSEGLVLAASPFGMIFAAPLAGRLARGIKPQRIAWTGMLLSSAGLLGISLAAGASLALVTMAMAAQGFGAGLFQVAYLDIVTGAIPAANRGVAGALGMATRTVGTVTGATVLMLVFQTLQPDGFLPAFQDTFRFAAALPILAIGLTALRRQAR